MSSALVIFSWSLLTNSIRLRTVLCFPSSFCFHLHFPFSVVVLSLRGFSAIRPFLRIGLFLLPSAVRASVFVRRFQPQAAVVSFPSAICRSRNRTARSACVPLSAHPVWSCARQLSVRVPACEHPRQLVCSASLGLSFRVPFPHV
jgi:hypothetical protein